MSASKLQSGTRRVIAVDSTGMPMLHTLPDGLVVKAKRSDIWDGNGSKRQMKETTIST